jgi:hypothetical protein
MAGLAALAYSASTFGSAADRWKTIQCPFLAIVSYYDWLLESFHFNSARPLVSKKQKICVSEAVPSHAPILSKAARRLGLSLSLLFTRTTALRRILPYGSVEGEARYASFDAGKIQIEVDAPGAEQRPRRIAGNRIDPPVRA